MSIDDIFKQRKKRWNALMKSRKHLQGTEMTCPECKRMIPVEDLQKTRWICRGCRHYFTIPPIDLIAMLCDEASFKEKFETISTRNPIDFPGYPEKLAKNTEKTKQQDAFVAGSARIHGIKVAVGVLDARFLMGSMGTVVGEKIVRLTEYANKRKCPLIIFSASGGARMQEGLFSLMQMAKTSAAIERFKNNGGLFISYLTNPTTGGVSASYASLGDIIIAEPNALIGFAGPRVIEQTIGQKLPEGFQRAQFQLEHGMVDMIVERKNMRQTLARILRMHVGGRA